MLARRVRWPQSPHRQCCIRNFSQQRQSRHQKNPSKWSKNPSHSQSQSRIQSSSPYSSAPDSSSAPTLYDRLFRQTPTTTDRPRPPRAERDGESEEQTKTPLPREELKQWLTKDLSGSEKKSNPAVSRKSEDDRQTVVVMHNMSPSLIESDFYRFAPQGHHVPGWAGGIVKVVQSVSDVTREPRGQYFVFFDTEHAAYAYLEELRKLPSATPIWVYKQRRMKPPHYGLSAATATDIAASPPDRSPATLEFVNPPQRISTSKLMGLIEAASPNRAKGPPQLRPLAESSAVPHRLAYYAKTRDFEPKGCPVLVRLAGSKITLGAMVRAIEADGAERNLPWRLVEPRPDDKGWPRQVQVMRAGSGEIRFGEGEGQWEQWEGEEEEGEEWEVAEKQSGADTEPAERGYTRFVVTFADTAEARRFARTWNQREMVDERTTRTMLVHTAALW